MISSVLCVFPFMSIPSVTFKKYSLPLWRKSRRSHRTGVGLDALGRHFFSVQQSRKTKRAGHYFLVSRSALEPFTS